MFLFSRRIATPTWLIFTALCLIVARPAHAYFSVIDTGDLIEPKKYQVSAEPQLIFNRYDGINLIGRFDTGLTDETGMRALIGFGKVDFQAGGFYKYMPFPDTPNQPAIGGEVGFIFARVNGNSEFSVRLHPIVSKRYETEVGDLIPYGSIPFGVTGTNGNTLVPVQLVGGAELRPLNFKNVSVFGELGINAHDSFSYLSAALAYRFDEDSIGNR